MKCYINQGQLYKCPNKRLYIPNSTFHVLHFLNAILLMLFPSSLPIKIYNHELHITAS